METYADLVDLFAAGVESIGRALADDRVVSMWDEPSVLEGQSVGGLAGHLARGGVWVVGDYLDEEVPSGPVAFETAGQYFATLMDRATPADHEGIRSRGREVASVGPVPLAEQLQARATELIPRLRSLDSDHLVRVAGGNIMRVSDYLETRIVEQTVHLDDLGLSVDCDGWGLPEPSFVLTMKVGIDIAKRRHGDPATLRALFRRGFADEVLPVL